LRTAKVVIEIVFRKNRVPKQVLEEAVLHFSEMKDQFISHFMGLGVDVDCRVFFESYSGAPSVSLLDSVNESRLMRIFTGGRKSNVDNKKS
jgi:hypothetical protein